MRYTILEKRHGKVVNKCVPLAGAGWLLVLRKVRVGHPVEEEAVAGPVSDAEQQGVLRHIQVGGTDD